MRVFLPSEVAVTAAFLASERAGAVTGTFVNVSSGMFPGEMTPASMTNRRQGKAA